MPKAHGKGAPKGNTYAEKADKGRTISLYIKAEDMALLRLVLERDGKEPTDSKCVTLAKQAALSGIYSLLLPQRKASFEDVAHAISLRDQIVALAQQIAIQRGYTALENGLQPVDALQAKYDHELLELAEKRALFLRDPDKEQARLKVLHEAADVLYYRSCLDYQASTASVTNGMPLLGISAQEIEAACLAKYTYRASGPGKKDEAHELELIKAALESLKKEN